MLQMTIVEASFFIRSSLVVTGQVVWVQQLCIEWRVITVEDLTLCACICLILLKDYQSTEILPTRSNMKRGEGRG